MRRRDAASMRRRPPRAERPPRRSSARCARRRHSAHEGGRCARRRHARHARHGRRVRCVWGAHRGVWGAGRRHTSTPKDKQGWVGELVRKVESCAGFERPNANLMKIIHMPEPEPEPEPEHQYSWQLWTKHPCRPTDRFRSSEPKVPIERLIFDAPLQITKRTRLIPLERNLTTDTLLTTMGARVVVRGVLPVVRSTIRVLAPGMLPFFRLGCELRRQRGCLLQLLRIHRILHVAIRFVLETKARRRRCVKKVTIAIGRWRRRGCGVQGAQKLWRGVSARRAQSVPRQLHS